MCLMPTEAVQYLLVDSHTTNVLCVLPAQHGRPEAISARWWHTGSPGAQQAAPGSETSFCAPRGSGGRGDDTSGRPTLRRPGGARNAHTARAQRRRRPMPAGRAARRTPRAHPRSPPTARAATRTCPRSPSGNSPSHKWRPTWGVNLKVCSRKTRRRMPRSPNPRSQAGAALLATIFGEFL